VGVCLCVCVCVVGMIFLLPENTDAKEVLLFISRDPICTVFLFYLL